MSEPIRVLQVMSTLDRGGAEAVAMDWLRRVDRDRVTFDFVVSDHAGPHGFEHEAQQLGCRIIRSPRFTGWNILPYTLWWYRCLNQHEEWRTVHAHHTVPAFAYLSVARLLGRKTIAHSHTSGQPGRIGRWARVALTWPLRRISEIRLACSVVAAVWMFGKRTSTVLVRNGVELERFQYSPESRSSVRRELGLETEFMIGHVGRFEEPKNHARLLRIFASLINRQPNARLLLVGDGSLRGQIERHIHALGLANHVILIGVREDVPDLLAAMDVLILPSHFEGLPVSLIEAQASGLPCVVSDAVTREVGLTGLVHFVSLDEPDEVWVDAVLDAASSGVRTSRVEELRAAGYDSAHVAEEIQQLYLNLSRRDEGSRADCEECHE